jgi:hypothetical protein
MKVSKLQKIIQEEFTKLLQEGWWDRYKRPYRDIANTIYDLVAPPDVPVGGYVPHEPEIDQSKAKEMMKHGAQPWEHAEKLEDAAEQANAAAAGTALLTLGLAARSGQAPAKPTSTHTPVTFSGRPGPGQQTLIEPVPESWLQRLLSLDEGLNKIIQEERAKMLNESWYDKAAQLATDLKARAQPKHSPKQIAAIKAANIQAATKAGMTDVGETERPEAARAKEPLKTVKVGRRRRDPHGRHKEAGAGAAEVKRAQAYKGKGGSGQVKDVPFHLQSTEASNPESQFKSREWNPDATQMTPNELEAASAQQLRDEGVSFKSTADANAAVQDLARLTAAEPPPPEGDPSTGPEEPAVPQPAVPQPAVPQPTKPTKHTSKSWNKERRAINAALQAGDITKAAWRKQRRANWKLMPSRTKKWIASRRAAKDKA